MTIDRFQLRYDCQDVKDDFAQIHKKKLADLKWQVAEKGIDLYYFDLEDKDLGATMEHSAYPFPDDLDTKDAPSKTTAEVACKLSLLPLGTTWPVTRILGWALPLSKFCKGV